MRRKALLKLGINGLTAAGGGLSVLAIALAFYEQPRAALVLMGVATVIDAIDGSLVRILGLEETAVRYDGERLDEYADLMTFVIAPVTFAWATDVLPFDPWGIGAGMVVIGVSFLQFSRTDNKTENAFWGWPSYWNILYFYGWGAELTAPWMIGISLALSAAVFAPVPFIYPSKLDTLKRLTLTGGFLWLGLLIAWLLIPSMGDHWLWISLVYPAYYLGLSFALYPRLKKEARSFPQNE